MTILKSKVRFVIAENFFFMDLHFDLKRFYEVMGSLDWAVWLYFGFHLAGSRRVRSSGKKYSQVDLIVANVALKT